MRYLTMRRHGLRALLEGLSVSLLLFLQCLQSMHLASCLPPRSSTQARCQRYRPHDITGRQEHMHPRLRCLSGKILVEGPDCPHPFLYMLNMKRIPQPPLVQGLCTLLIDV